MGEREAAAEHGGEGDLRGVGSCQAGPAILLGFAPKPTVGPMPTACRQLRVFLLHFFRLLIRLTYLFSVHMTLVPPSREIKGVDCVGATG
jgi:hypothetical protein